MQDLQIDFHPPDDVLGWTKAMLDSGAAVIFIVVLIVVIYARNRYPVMERNRTFPSQTTFGGKLYLETHSVVIIHYWDFHSRDCVLPVL